MKISIGADHGGYELKETIKQILADRGIDLDDRGCLSTDSTDYPDFARDVAIAVSEGRADQGILVCSTGIGMSITANRFPYVRAALCLDRRMARLARQHNDANVLVLGAADEMREQAVDVLDQWLADTFSGAERHRRRLGKIARLHHPAVTMPAVLKEDREVYDVIGAEIARQQQTINLIASENLVSPAVRQAQACVMTNKYAEGYPRKRWYNGCRFVDAAEQFAIDRAKVLFGADHANVQPHCGSTANMAVYFAALDPGDTVMAMDLAHGGHLTHGSAVNFSGRMYNFVSYGVDADSEQIDYDAVAAQARDARPKLIMVGASAYPRVLDFERFRAIADEVGALLVVDMAHIAGLIAAGRHPSPIPYAEFVTTTTHKTLRGPRGGMILCREDRARDIDKQIFPGTQGGPLMHTIAAKAVCFREALQPAFKTYGEQVVTNARAMAGAFLSRDMRLVSGGTDNHLILMDVTSLGLTGKDAAAALETAGVVVNKNAIPFDRNSPFVTSGIRIGTPTITTRGMGADACGHIATLIADVLQAPDDPAVIARVRGNVEELAAAYPAP